MKSEKFHHIADDLHELKKVVFTAHSCKNFHLRMHICKYVFEQNAIPINPFNLYGYFLYDMVERNRVRNANNNILRRCDELWVFGEISDGVLSEIICFRELNKNIRFFDLSKLPDEIVGITPEDVIFENDLEQFRSHIVK